MTGPKGGRRGRSRADGVFAGASRRTLLPRRSPTQSAADFLLTSGPGKRRRQGRQRRPPRGFARRGDGGDRQERSGGAKAPRRYVLAGTNGRREARAVRHLAASGPLRRPGSLCLALGRPNSRQVFVCPAIVLQQQRETLARPKGAVKITAHRLAEHARGRRGGADFAVQRANVSAPTRRRHRRAAASAADRRETP